MFKHRVLLSTLASLPLSALLAGCPAPGHQGPSGTNAAVFQEPVAPGAECPSGGVRVLTGLDLDDSGTLELDEATQATLLCSGAAGENGRTALVSTSPLLPGERGCGHGGELVSYGLDSSAGIVGELDPEEVLGEFPVCNGQAGAPGLVSLLALRPLALGEMGCEAGGLELRTGIDSNGDFVLSAEEQLGAPQPLCNGRDGYNSLNRFTSIPSQPGCLAGGLRTETGLDLDRSGTLEDSEINAAATLEVCFSCGVPGSATCWEGAFESATVNVAAVTHTVNGIALGDTNRDGILDMVLVAGSELWIYRGTGARVSPMTLVERRFMGMSHNRPVLTDVNGDGILDLLLSSITNANIVRAFGAGDGSFGLLVPVDSINRPEAFQVFDINGDGFVDIVTPSNFGFDIAYGAGDGNFPTGITSTEFGSAARHVVVTDFNRDGHKDIILCGVPRAVTGYAANGIGGYAQAFSIPLTDICTGLVAHDWNGDGHLDIAWVRGAFGSTTRLYMAYSIEGAPYFSEPVLDIASGLAVSELLVAHLNADPIADLLTVGNSSGAGWRSWLMGLNGETATLGNTVTGSTPSRAAVGDLDRDGKNDVVVNNVGGSGVTIKYGR
jgi:hypothetical protein